MKAFQLVFYSMSAGWFSNTIYSFYFVVLTASYRTVIYFSNKQNHFQFVQGGEVLVNLWKLHSTLCSPVFKIVHKQKTQMLLAKHIKPLH